MLIPARAERRARWSAAILSCGPRYIIPPLDARIDRDIAARLTVILPIEVMYQCLYTRLVQVADVARRLSRFLSRHDTGWGDGPESVDDDFSTDGLDGIDDDGYSSRVELFERLRRDRAGEG